MKKPRHWKYRKVKSKKSTGHMSHAKITQNKKKKKKS